MEFDYNQPIRLKQPFCSTLQEGKKTNRGFHFGIKGARYWYLPQDINHNLPLNPRPDAYKIGTILVSNGFKPIQANIDYLYDVLFEYFVSMRDLQWFSNAAMSAPYNNHVLHALKSKCVVLPYWYRPHGRELGKGTLPFIRKLVTLFNLIVDPIVRKDLRYVKYFDHKNWSQVNKRNEKFVVEEHMYQYINETIKQAYV